MERARQDSRQQPLRPTTSKASRREDSLTDKFIRRYAQLRMPADAPFEERLRFDVYKRATKMDKFNSLLDKQKKRLPNETLNSTFEHLIQDALRRKDQNERVEVDRDNLELRQHREPRRKLTAEESQKIYAEHMRKWHERNAVVEGRRKEKQHAEDMAALVRREAGHHVRRGDSVDLVTRMDADIKKRKEKMQEMLKEKQEDEDSKLGSCFAPRVNLLPASHHMHTKSELNRSVFARMEKDVRLRGVKELLRDASSKDPIATMHHVRTTSLVGSTRKKLPAEGECTPNFEHSQLDNKGLRIAKKSEST